MVDDILHNSPALHALKRHQLVSLSKRYGLKSSGKNLEIIDRLKLYASTHSPSRDLTLPLPASSPANALSDFAMQDDPTHAPPSPGETISPRPTVFAQVQRRPETSDAWEVLSESGASLISPAKDNNVDSIRSWKSAGNGESISEFGADDIPPSSSRSKSSSMRALATSLSRRASKHLLPGSNSASSQLDKAAKEAETADPVEEMDDLPPSPASTVGIPRRHSTIRLLERPSTIRLVSPPPAPSKADHQPELDSLPFFSPNGRALKERRTMAPLSSVHAPSSYVQHRSSMSALPKGTTASVSSIYPSLPSPIPPVTPIPGEYQANPLFPSKTFGMSISNAQFEDAGKKILAEMDAKLRATLGDNEASFGQELLKGKKAEINKLVDVREGLGEGDWGLAKMSSASRIKDRYAESHQREFAKMQSIGENRKTSSRSKLALSTSSTINKPAETPGMKRKHSSGRKLPSAPNGMPLVPAEPEGRETKRKRLSAGPNALGSLRSASKSFVNMLGEGAGKTPVRPAKRRTSSVLTGKGRTLAFPLALFRAKRKESLANHPLKAAAKASEAATNGKTSESGRQSGKMSGIPVQSSPRQKTSRESSKAETIAEARASSSGTTIEGQRAKERARSSSAQTVMSTSSRKRSRIPDFGAHPPVSRSGSISAMGLPKSQSSTMSMSMRKQSQLNLIRNARPAPSPPSINAQLAKSANNQITTQPQLMKRPSTLYMPTASSIARIQATVKPPTDRPLPVPPASMTAAKLLNIVQSSDNATSRANTFDASFNMPRPTGIPPKFKAGQGSPMKGSPARSPAKTVSSTGVRARAMASGLSAVKSKENSKGEAGVQARRAEIKAKQERMMEERGLRALLGVTGDMDMRK